MDIQIDVTFRSMENHAFGPLEAGNRVLLRRDIKDIEIISYYYEGHRCILTHDQLNADALPGKYGEKHIVKLRPCS